MGNRLPSGVGLGLRNAFADDLFSQHDLPLQWLEVHPENYIERGGRFAFHLERALARFPVVPHGLTLGLGSLEPFNKTYLQQLKHFLADIKAPWYSDHLCWSSGQGVMFHDLLPFPLTRELLSVCARRIEELQDTLGMPVAVENISYYVAHSGSEMSESEFIAALLDRTQAKLLLDVNNVFVNAQNHGFDSASWLKDVPWHQVVQIHVAGHWVRDDGILIDTHGADVRPEVFGLLGKVLERTGPVPVLLERDDNFPKFEHLISELRMLQTLYAESIRGAG